MYSKDFANCIKRIDEIKVIEDMPTKVERKKRKLDDSTIIGKCPTISYGPWLILKL